MPRVLIGVGLCVLVLVGASASEAGPVKAKKSARSVAGRAGAVDPARPRVPDAGKMAINGAFGYGLACAVSELANVHPIGLVPANTTITIEFWSDEESDPIAALHSVQFKDFAAGGERFTSDDEGGELNPYFQLQKDYTANWVLTVGAADGGVACYTYKVTLQ
jgi:hypothetical protein